MALLRTVLIVFFGCVIATTAAAQDNPDRVRMWGAIGAGASVPTSGGDAITNLAQLVVQKQPHQVTLRALLLHDLGRPTNEIGELGLLYGRMWAYPWGHASISAGASGVGFDTCPDDDDSCFTVGLPVVAEVARSTRFIGLGFQIFGNLNSKASYGGGVLFLQLGRLK